MAVYSGLLEGPKTWPILVHYVNCGFWTNLFIQKVNNLEATCQILRLPPGFHKDLDRLRNFLQALQDVILNPSLCSRTGSAQRSEESLPRRPDSSSASGRLKRPIKRSQGLTKAVFEFRHESWFSKDTYELLSKFNAAFCIHDLVGIPTPRVITSDIIYIRFHGPTGKYAGNYSNSALCNWAKWLKDNLKAKKAVYAYFNNDYNAYAVNNARQLREILLTLF